MRSEDLPALGVGLGYRPPLRTDVFRRRPALDFLEITIDHYLEAPPEKLDELDLLAEHFTLIPHGLNLSLGSAEGLDERYLEAIAAIVERIRPPWWSEHVAFTKAGGVEIGHLAPLPRSPEALDALSANIERARRAISYPLILENITATVDLPGSTMAEAEFLAELCRRAGCGLLLDLTNLWLNAQRAGRDPRRDLAELLEEAAGWIVQLHFVGPERRGSEWIDSHAMAVPEQIWELLEVTMRAAPVRAAALERDRRFPPFDELLAELERARRMGREAGRWT